MKRLPFMLLVPLLVLTLIAGHAAWADDYPSKPADTMSPPGELFTPEELDELLAPIALYPDPLLAQILPAATFIDQIDEAERYVRQYGQSPHIDDQPWDVSVRAVAHYPDVLYMMDQKYEWTASLGQAYVDQPQEVLDTIQRLRAEARGRGNLVSTPQQQVIVEDDNIRIVPAAPEVIYVPRYDPMVVYVEPPPTYGFVTFGIGFTIGAWLNRDCDWHRHRIYYHGWNGSGWIGRARPYIGPRSSVYISNNYTVVNVNRRVVRHDTVRYRADVRRNVEYRRERLAVPAAPVRPDRRPALPTGTPRTAPLPVRRTDRATQPGATTAVPTPRAVQPRIIAPTTSAPRPGNAELYRGRVPKQPQPSAGSGYGGYGSAKDAASYRERGQSSRENMKQLQRQPPAIGNNVRPRASGGRQPAPGPAAPRPAPPASRGDSKRQPR